MKNHPKQTEERIIPEKISNKQEYLIYLRHMFAYQYVRKKILNKSLVLDFGCGVGYGTKLLSKSVNKILGIDTDREAVDYASLKYGTKNCVFYSYDGHKIPFPSENFDIVVSFQVIEHIQNDSSIISELYRVLKKGGRLFLTTPNRVYRLKRGQKPWNRYHVREYDSRGLEKVLRGKFSKVRIWGISGSKEINRFERERVNKILNLTFFDPLNLRNLIPEFMKPGIIKVWRNFVSKDKADKKYSEKYSTNDYQIVKSEVESSLDLLAICKK